MNLAEVIISQYLAALDMLKQTITKCPESIWNDPRDKTAFWRIAYHALFYTHLYLQESEKTFKGWANHRPDYHLLGPTPWPPHDLPKIGEPYDQATVLDYLAFCQQQVRDLVPRLDLDSESSGFEWLPFGKLELQFYTIRHLQQHTGELMDRLGTRAAIEIDWVGMKHEE
jgi:hypothetical protein